MRLARAAALLATLLAVASLWCGALTAHLRDPIERSQCTDAVCPANDGGLGVGLRVGLQEGLMEGLQEGLGGQGGGVSGENWLDGAFSSNCSAVTGVGLSASRLEANWSPFEPGDSQRSLYDRGLISEDDILEEQAAISTQGFRASLSLFFPCVTGIMAARGAAKGFVPRGRVGRASALLMGSPRELDPSLDPSRSQRRHTPAVTLSFTLANALVYMASVFLLGAVASRASLGDETTLLAAEIAWPGPLMKRACVSLTPRPFRPPPPTCLTPIRVSPTCQQNHLSTTPSVDETKTICPHALVSSRCSAPRGARRSSARAWRRVCSRRSRTTPSYQRSRHSAPNATRRSQL